MVHTKNPNQISRMTTDELRDEERELHVVVYDEGTLSIAILEYLQRIETELKSRGEVTLYDKKKREDLGS